MLDLELLELSNILVVLRAQKCQATEQRDPGLSAQQTEILIRIGPELPKIQSSVGVTVATNMRIMN